VEAGAGDTKVVVKIVDSIERSGTGAKQKLIAKTEPKETCHA
jgi:hypothetical protein